MGDGVQSIMPGWNLIPLSSGAKAGNTTYTITSPADRRYSIVGCRITLTADGTVATRNIKVRIEDGSGNPLGPTMTGTNVTASGTGKLSMIQGSAPYGGTWSEDDAVFYLPRPIELLNAICLIVSIGNGVVGDSFTARFIVRESDG